MNFWPKAFEATSSIDSMTAHRDCGNLRSAQRWWQIISFGGTEWYQPVMHPIDMLELGKRRDQLPDICHPDIWRCIHTPWYHMHLVISDKQRHLLVYNICLHIFFVFVYIFHVNEARSNFILVIGLFIVVPMSSFFLSIFACCFFKKEIALLFQFLVAFLHYLL